jgi:hypothetical protein
MKFLISLHCLIGFVVFANAQIALAQEVINNSSIAFTVQEKDILSESLAFDAKTGDFFISSTRKGKILKRSPDGTTSDFATQDDGLWMTIGIKLDDERRHLWVCSSGGSNLIGYDRSNSGPAGIFKFDLDSGELLWSFVLDEPTKTHFFNDIVIAKDGTAYASHMFEDAAIYVVKENRASILSQPDFLSFPNGLTLSSDERYLFVAHRGGIGRLELASGEWRNLSSEDNIKGSDGLYFYKNTLLGVVQDERSVKQFVLDETLERVTKVNILEQNHPMMNQPTTGVLADDIFYYIANAQFESFNEDGSLFPSEKLYDLTVLQLSLKN